MSRYFNKRALFHEAGHLIENLNPSLVDANKEFIKKRAFGRIKKLYDLCNSDVYRSNEKAYQDSFIDPYVGSRALFEKDENEGYSTIKTL